jgi:hypothetical protein
MNSVLVSVKGAADAVPVAASSSAALIPMMFRMLRSLEGGRRVRMRGKNNNSSMAVN